jgi:hypothetical protein
MRPTCFAIVFVFIGFELWYLPLPAVQRLSTCFCFCAGAPATLLILA